MKKETVVYKKDGIEIIVRGDRNDNRVWLFQTIIQNVFTKRNLKDDEESELYTNQCRRLERTEKKDNSFSSRFGKMSIIGKAIRNCKRRNKGHTETDIDK